MKFTSFEEADVELTSECDRSVLKQGLCLSHAHMHTLQEVIEENKLR